MVGDGGHAELSEGYLCGLWPHPPAVHNVLEHSRSRNVELGWLSGNVVCARFASFYHDYAAFLSMSSLGSQTREFRVSVNEVIRCLSVIRAEACRM